MENQESTHLVFDWEKIIISPDLTIIFNFLMEIEKEVQSFLWFEKKLEDIRKQSVEFFGLITYLAKQLEENKIDYKFNFSEKPANFIDKLNYHLPIRSQFIMLFANLETIFCLYTAYQLGTDNEEEIRKEVMNSDKTRKFLNKFILNDENDYYKLNKTRLSKISANNIRDLRNSLNHFYSVSSSISLVPNQLDEKARKIEAALKKQWEHNSIFLSPNDTTELISKAGLLLFRNWSNDFSKDPKEFKRKITFVTNIVNLKAPVLIRNWDIK